MPKNIFAVWLSVKVQILHIGYGIIVQRKRFVLWL